jgi:hypothetical protein
MEMRFITVDGEGTPNDLSRFAAQDLDAVRTRMWRESGLEAGSFHSRPSLFTTKGGTVVESWRDGQGRLFEVRIAFPQVEIQGL